MRWVAALPVALWSSIAAASFHPVEDRPYRYDTVETRTADGVVRRFHASRTVVFHRTPDGFDVRVTLDAVDQQAGGDVGRMFLAATGALLHRPLLYHVDSEGRLLDVADPDAAIALIADAIERMGVADRDRRGDSKALASPLRAMPPERKRGMLLSILQTVLAGSAAGRVPGQRPVTVPSRPPLAPGTALAGIETVSRGADGRMTIAIEATGGIDAAAPPDAPRATLARPTGAPTAKIRTVRNIDPLSGLVLDSREIGETSVGDSATVHAARIETVVTLRPPPK